MNVARITIDRVSLQNHGESLRDFRANNFTAMVSSTNEQGREIYHFWYLLPDGYPDKVTIYPHGTTVADEQFYPSARVAASVLEIKGTPVDSFPDHVWHSKKEMHPLPERWYKIKPEPNTTVEGKGTDAEPQGFAIAPLSEASRTAVAPDLIENLVPSNTYLTDLIGHDGSGKTGATLILAMQAALGRKVFGTLKVARPLRTLLIEDDTNEMIIGPRIDAIREAMRLSASQRKQLADNFLITYGANFTFQHPKRLEDTLSRYQTMGKPIDLVCIDNRSTAFGYTNPDDPVEARRVYYEVMRPLAQEYGCKFFVLSYPTKLQFDRQGRKLPPTIAGTRLQQQVGDVRVSLWTEETNPPLVSFTWHKDRTGTLKNKTMTFRAVVDPAKEPRGWIDLALSKDTATSEPKAVVQVYRELRDFVGVQERTRQECVSYIENELAFKTRTVDEALRRLMKHGLITSTKDGKTTLYRTVEEPTETDSATI